MLTDDQEVEARAIVSDLNILGHRAKRAGLHFLCYLIEIAKLDLKEEVLAKHAVEPPIRTPTARRRRAA